MAGNLSSFGWDRPVWSHHYEEIFPPAKRTLTFSHLSRHQQATVPSFHSLVFKKMLLFFCKCSFFFPQGFAPLGITEELSAPG